MPQCTRVLDDELIPQYLELPHFLGLVVLESDVGGRPEIVGLSAWDGDVHDSDAIIGKFLQRLYDIAGLSAMQKSYDVLRPVARQDVSEAFRSSESAVSGVAHSFYVVRPHVVRLSCVVFDLSIGEPAVDETASINALPSAAFVPFAGRRAKKYAQPASAPRPVGSAQGVTRSVPGHRRVREAT